MTLYRGTGGGGNATTDTEVALLTQLEQSATAAAAAAEAAQAAALLAATEAAESASSIEGDVASAEAARIAAEAAQEAAEEAQDAAVAAQGLAEDARDAALAAEAALENVYTKDEADDLLDLKANQATTYTKTETDTALALKLNAANPSYTGTLTGGTGVINIGSGQFYKDASGNVGIGTSSPTALLDVRGSATTAKAIIQNTSNGAEAFNGSGAGLELLAKGMNNTSKYTPSIKFGSTNIDFTTTNPKFGAAIIAEAAQTYSTDTAGGMDLSFWTSPTNPGTGSGITERARIDSSGNLLVGTTSVPGVNNARAGVVGAYTSDSNSTARADQRTALVLLNNGGVTNDSGAYSALVLSVNQGAAVNAGVLMRGYGGNGGATYSIQINGNGNITNTNNSYGSLSDESLKENIVDATPKLNDLMAVQVRSYNLKADEKKTKQLGVVAQELEAVFPAMVETEADGLKSVKYSVFVPMLIKAIQELKGINDAQAQIITALTARVEALEGAQPND
jgi:hypothetical protein